MRYQPLSTAMFYAELSIRMYLNNQVRGIRHSEQVLSRVSPTDRYHHNGRSCSLDSRVRRSIASRKQKIATVEKKLATLLA
jgi:hypothetical protein